MNPPAPRCTTAGTDRPPLEIERLVSDHERRSPATDAQADLPPPSYHDDIFDLSAVDANREGSKP